jgi:hypothetical protein
MNEFQRAVFIRYHVMVPMGCGVIGAILGNALWEIAKHLG